MRSRKTFIFKTTFTAPRKYRKEMIEEPRDHTEKNVINNGNNI